MTQATPEIRHLSLLDLSYPQTLPPQISIPASEISAHKWRKIVQKTDREGTEHGINTAIHKGKFYHSKITPGRRTRPNYDGLPGSMEPASWSAPLFPFGYDSWRYLFGLRDILDIHGHPMLQDRAHLATTIMSKGDIQSFAESNLRARIMVDRGGGHMLLRSFPYEYLEDAPWERLLEESFKNQEYIFNAVRTFATKIASSGIQYYFTPEIDHTEDGLVTFMDARSLLPAGTTT